MAKLRGVVLASRPDHVILLTNGGEYRKVSIRGQHYSVGEEVQLTTGHTVWWAAAACAALFLAAIVFVSVGPQPVDAYLVMDVNPSVFISLTADGRVRSAEGLNEDGDTLLQGLDLAGLQATLSVKALLTKAHSDLYLIADRENIVLVCLAAPSSYVVTTDELFDLVMSVVSDLELDAFVAVPKTTPEQALTARSQGQSVNAVILRRQLTERGLMGGSDETGPPPPVREMLEQVPASARAGLGSHVRGSGEDRQPGPSDNETDGPHPASGRSPVPPRQPPGKGNERTQGK